MPDKLVRIGRASRPGQDGPARPVMLAIAGDSAAGKTTLTRGLVETLGPERCTSICVDDYHRYDRFERKEKPFTALHPEGNYVNIMEQHLQLLAAGQPILKPVYDHHTGMLVRPELIEPREYVIIEGLLPLFTKMSRACFDVSVYLDLPEDIRRDWKVRRDTRDRGYSAEAVLAELERREPESQAFIRPQRQYADIVVRFAPIEGRNDPPGTPLSVSLMLRPTIAHPNIAAILDGEDGKALHVKLVRDQDGKPVDALHIHGYAPREASRKVETEIWGSLGEVGPLPEGIGKVDGKRTEPVAITQLLLLYHIIANAKAQESEREANG